MEFRLLGDIELIVDGGLADIGRRRERRLLALLLLEAGKTIPVERLTELLLDGDRPSEPRKALRQHVSRLRHLLAKAGVADRVQLVSSPAGYALHVDPATVDVHRFSDLVDRARARTDPAERAALLRDALALWRGPALADAITGGLREHLCAHLEERRLAALELRIEADLELGRHAELIPELTDLGGRYPTRERLVAARMLALYRCGRTAEALSVYGATRRLLADELGADPGARLQQLHTAILRNDPALDPPPVDEPRADRPSVPAQLPADLAIFSGREDELARVLDPTLDGYSSRSAVAVTLITGMAGAGKTALAVHAAHALVPEFPDGQLFVDLNGFTSSVAAADPAAVLAALLRALGVPPGSVPGELAERAALYRSYLAGQRILVVLDNAASEAQVRPLLPGSPGCRVLVTSRRRLAGLEAQAISLDTMPSSDAVGLLTSVAGPGRLRDESPELVATVTELCGRLPLALGIIGTRLRTHRSWPLRHVVERLTGGSSRLAELSAGDRSVAAAFWLSYENLPAGQRTLFRGLGLHRGPDFDAHLVAAVSGTDLATAEEDLEALAAVHLLREHEPGRYRVHDLLRDYAGELAAANDSPADRAGALDRIAGYYLRAARAAVGALTPSGEIGQDLPASTVPFGGADAALAWLERERANLLAVAGQLADAGECGTLAALSSVLWRFLDSRGYQDDAFVLHSNGLRAALTHDDIALESRARHGLGVAHWRNGRYDEAREHFDRALAAAHEVGDVELVGRCLGNLGLVNWRTGRLLDALAQFEQALTLARDRGDGQLEGRVLHKIGVVRFQLGEHDEALAFFRKASRLAESTVDDLLLAEVRNAMGVAERALGRPSAAIEHHQQALRLAGRLGSRDQAVRAHDGLARIYRDLHQPAGARDHGTRAKELYRLLGPAAASEIRNELDAAAASPPEPACAVLGAGREHEEDG